MAQTMEKKSIIETRHPSYLSNSFNWIKFRLTYEGGRFFIQKYLKRLSKRETNEEFLERKAVTYCPAFAKAALNDVKNAIFQRTCDITRKGGSSSYSEAVKGQDGGVDLRGSSMNSFLGRKILPELLSMGRVGIFVDMPPIGGPTKRDAQGKRPYVYWYRAEDILSWDCNDPQNPTEITNLLLGDCTIQLDEDSFLPCDDEKRYRHLWIDPDTGLVNVQYYDDCGDCCNSYGEKDDDDTGPIELKLTKIPFVVLELSDSLLTDVADYQIALLNMESADISYAIKSNFPFYVEQYDPRAESSYLKKTSPNENPQNQTNFNYQTSVVETTTEKTPELRLGSGSGRRYPLGATAPAFIHPSAEPLRVSMEKEDQLKRDIRHLINLTITNLQPKVASSTLKSFDNQGLESGLSYIGMELEYAERRIAQFWAMYENGDTATINYPENYSLISDGERRQQAKDLNDLMPQIPSRTYQREIAKKIVNILLATKVSAEILLKIEQEIDSADVVITDPDVIQQDFESGFVGLDTASKARGYPAGEVAKAKKDHEDRIARIAISQSEAGGMGKARGVGDLGNNPKQGVQEKTISRDNTLNDKTESKVRGEGQ